MLRTKPHTKLIKALVIREKLAGLYESEQEWSKAAQMLSDIDLDSGMRAVDNKFKFSNCIKIARLYLEICLSLPCTYAQ
ncbi:unnamed protein product [Arabidopsis halleri]